jgi:hypothetical protein
MTALSLYLLKTSACMLIIYGFYRLAFQHEKTLHFNRIYLLAGLLASLLLPALHFTVYVPDVSAWFEKEPVTTEATIPAAYFMAESASAVVAEKARSVDWTALLLTAYLVVAALFLLGFLVNLTRIIFRIIDGETVREGDHVFVLSDKDGIPHSFLFFIFVNRADFESGSIRSEIIRHEKVHGAQWHSLDILLAELVKVIFWFNPVAWLFKRSMQLNHEYLADSTVLKDYEIKAYQRALVDYAYRNQAVALVSNFNYSFTKKRLMMMTRMKTNKWRFGSKLALLLPVLLLAFLVSANCQAKQEPPAEKELTPEEQVEAQQIKEARAQAEYEMQQAKKAMEEARKQMDAAKKEMEEQKKIIKEKKVIIDGEGKEIELELEKIMEDLEKELDGLDIDIQQLMKDIQKGINIELDEEFEIDGVKKQIKIKTGGADGAGLDFDFDFDFEFEDDGKKKVMVISQDGEAIEIKGDGGQDMKIIKKVEVDSQDGGDGEYIIKIKSADGSIHKEIHEDVHVINCDDHTIKVIDKTKDGEVEKKVIVIKDGGEVEWIEKAPEKEIEVIVITEDGDKKKKRKNK